MKRQVAVIALLLGVGLSVSHSERVFANIPPSIGLSVAPYTQDFNSLVSSGSSGVTPPGWAFAESGSSGNNNGLLVAGTGSSTAGDVYSFGVANDSDRALGTLGSGTLTPTIGAQVTNNTGATLVTLLVSYTGEQWRLGQNTAGRGQDRLDFQYSTTATSLTTGTWTDVNALDFSSPVTTGTTGALVGNNAPNRTLISATITDLNIPDGASFFIRWSEFDLAPGAEDGLAIDDVCLAANGGICGEEAPRVLSVSPAGIAPINTNIVVTFSEPVTATANAFSIDCGGPVTFSPSSSADHRIFTLDPSGNLPFSANCVVTIHAAQITDDDTVDPPDTMAASHTHPFTTEAAADTAPSITATSPVHGAINVPAASNIVMTFSENVNAPAGAFSLACESSAPTFGVTGSGSNVISIDPDSTLPYSTSCTVHVTAASITDTDTNDPPDAMTADVTFSFTTEARPPATNVMINEVDADTPGDDRAEFVELYDGGVGNTPLDGLVVVFYDSTSDVPNDTVYAQFDLDGFSTDANGYFVLGNPGVPNVGLEFDPGMFGLLQNGADAVAIYVGSGAGFPNDQAVTTAGLIDAIVYDTDDADRAALLALLNSGQPQVNENASGNSQHHSNQRCANGTGGMRNTSSYVPFTPTPGAANQCPASRPPSDIVISEVYGGGGNSGAQYHNDFVELFNRGTDPVDVGGWSLQYTSAAGNTWESNVQPLGGIIGPGEYFLIALGAGTGGGAVLPPANINGAINMSATNGKVALVDNFDALAGGCPIFNPHVMDFVGYGSADCGEGGTRAPMLSNTTALFRKIGGAQDTDHNASDFVTGAPNPNLGPQAPIVEIGPFVFRTDPSPNNVEAPRDPTIIVSFTEAVDVTDPWLAIDCSVTGVHDDYTQAGGGTFHAVTPNVTMQPGETCTVTVFKDQVHDSDLVDAADNTDTLRANVTWSFIVATGDPAPYPPEVHLAMGNPSGADADPANYLMSKAEFALSYDRDGGRPNWVSWHLSDEWTGNLTRDDTFRADPELPADWYRVQSFDFSGSGFDRGHLTPNADRNNANSVPINQATFLMTNMIAQAPDNNQGPWAAFENYLRTLLPGSEIYIVAGPAGIGGTGSNGGATTIADGNVAVPEETWKVALVLSKGSDDISRASCTTRTIAVKMPNIQGIRFTPWEDYITTVDAIETLTGYDFFSALPDGVEYCVEAGTNGVNPPPDLDPPAITLTTPADGGFYQVDTVVTAAFACADEDSGLATCTGTVVNGAAIDTTTLGATTFVVTATDAVGNVSSTTVTYNVVKKLPATIAINNLPSLAAKGGSFTPAFDYTGQGTVHVDSLTQSVCKVTGGDVKFVGAGTCTLQARGTPNGVYDWATGPLQSFVIVP